MAKQVAEALSGTAAVTTAGDVALGVSLEVLDRRALVTDLCNPVQLLLDGPGRIALTRMDTPCEASLIPLPLPGAVAFVEKMVVAALAGVEEAVVVPEEGVAYLKVDRRVFDVSGLP